MSKNVAVFVDVANIFYAAKAAGIDIDYVTLLKSATAGRDFVRAYAYTGLDPENENQRQFHAFLGRSGYKVISKDIRKYGDGRIKANLDIELVVDMMRMGDKLDIAVVVSGDGDFAPAIAAVQQMGVRVEVISFRGNTSSDLIDVADIFIDITTVAKVEKGARSGRRVATDGDLSMTEVPDKESGVTPRRRRRRGESDEKTEKSEKTSRPARRSRSSKPAGSVEEPATLPASAASTGLVALPGEKLSRGGETPAAAEAPAEVPLETPAEIPLEPETSESPQTTATDDQGPAEPGSEDGNGRRRRRRRGGRGRGRGGRAEEQGSEQASSEMPAAPAPPESDAVAEHPDEVPTLPQHSGFGSVWDSQIGTPSGSQASASETAYAGDDELDAEPEVPEYMAAEKKQQQGRRRGGRGGAGRQGGYRSAIDRERYGGNSSSRSGGSYRSGSRSRGGQGSRSASSPARPTAQAMTPIEQTPGGDPWSEVPPEVQELLKAEMARRDSGPTSKAAADAAEAKPKKTTRKKAAPKAATAEAAADAAEAKPKKTTRKKAAPKAATAEDTEA